jgi:hypothetical protein
MILEIEIARAVLFKPQKLRYGLQINIYSQRKCGGTMKIIRIIEKC